MITKKARFGLTILFAFAFSPAIQGLCQLPSQNDQKGTQVPFASPNDQDPSQLDSLKLSDVLARVLLYNPELKAFSLEIRAKEASILQAGLFPNPQLGFGIENFSGSGELRGTQAAEYTVGLGQLIELGGERPARKRLAESERALSQWDYEIVRLDILSEATQRFVNLLASQKRLDLADSLLQVAEKFNDSVSKRIAAGKVTPIEGRRAEIVLSLAKVDLQNGLLALRTDRHELAAMWAEASPTFELAVGDFEKLGPIPSYFQIEALVEESPIIARWVEEMTLRREVVSLEKAKAIPNPTISFGGRRFNDLGLSGLVASISVPLPVFDRNQGRIKEARIRIEQVSEMANLARITAKTALTVSHSMLVTSAEEALVFETTVLPAAQKNLAATVAGYAEGKFDLLVLLDAQKTLLEASHRYINALATYHTSRADVERLLAIPLETITGLR